MPRVAARAEAVSTFGRFPALRMGGGGGNVLVSEPPYPMKIVIRALVVGACLTTFSATSLAAEASASVSSAPQTAGSTPVIVSSKQTLSAGDLARYQQLEEQSKAKTDKQAAGAAMDKTTIVIIAVLAVVVIVAASSGGGSGGGGY